MSVIDSIKHYQRSIEKYPNDEKRLLHCISKLSNLPITVSHLEETGIGRTVNSFRKNDGNVGQAARNLVIKWKELVAADSSDGEEGSDGQQGFQELKNGRRQEDEDNYLKIAEIIAEQVVMIESSQSPLSSKSHKSNKHDNSDRKKDHHRRERDHSSSSKKSSKKESSDESRRRKNHKKKSHKSSDKEYHHHKRNDDKKKRDKDNHKKDKDEASSSSKSITSHQLPPKRKLIDIDMMAVTQNGGGGHSSDDEIGITSKSGTSFADALGGGSSAFIIPPVKKKTKIESKIKSPPVKSSLSPPVKDNNTKLDLLSPNAKLTPLNLDITLPAITPNYQPLPNSEVLWGGDLGGKSSKTEEEALSIVMNKNYQRTKVYSGNKILNAEVPSLFDLCIRILQDNIDALAYTGGVPYDILSPILERCSPEQLFTMEHHNAYLLEDTDGLWEQHCKREFRGRRREEFETWREAYSRFLSEREEKLKALTANIKQTIQKSVPVRQTKLAYVDSTVKPPRGVARKQAKYGTSSSSATARPSVTPASRAQAVANATNITGLVPVPNPVSARPSASSSNNHGSFKPKKAPLMQKTLALIKSTNRYRR